MTPQSPPKETPRKEQNGTPEQHAGAVSKQERCSPSHTLHRSPVTLDRGVAKPEERGAGHLKSGAILLEELHVESCKVHTIAEILSLRLHALNLAANPI